jgi:hypothetical protein
MTMLPRSLGRAHSHTWKGRGRSASYQLRVTRRALADLGLSVELHAGLVADDFVESHEVVRAFIKQRGQMPEGQETTTLPATAAVVFNLHHGRYRALTWFDRPRRIVWLLGVGYHESGSREDAYAVLKRRDEAGELFPTEQDYRDVVPDTRSFLAAAWRELPRLLQRAEGHVGTPVAATIHDVLDVEILIDPVQVEGETFAETTVRFHMPPRMPGVLPGNWMERLLPLVFPRAEAHEIECIEASREGWIFRWSSL